MRVLYIMNGPGMAVDVISGGDKRAIEVARRLLKAGVQVEFLTTPGGIAMCRREGLEVPYRVLSAALFKQSERWKIERGLSYAISAAHFAVGLHRLRGFDVVYTTSDFFCDTLPAFLYKGRRPSSRWIAILHHLYPPPSVPRPGNRLINAAAYGLQRFSFRLMRRRADRMLVLDTLEGQAIARTLQEIGVPGDRIVPVQNGIDRKAIAQVEAPPCASYDACVVGQLRPSKGIFDLVPIWRRVCGLKPGAFLAIVGGGDQRYVSALREEIAAAGLSDQITLAGFVPEEEKLRIMKSSRLLIAPSREEGWGISVCEALACGLPVVAYDLPAYRNIYGSAIHAVPPFDREAFGDAVLQLLEDPVRRDELRQKGLGLSAAYDWDAIAERELRLMEEAVLTGRPQGRSCEGPCDGE